MGCPGAQPASPACAPFLRLAACCHGTPPSLSHSCRYDSLTGVPAQQRALAFEKGSVLFNIGALHTQIGARQDRSCPKGASRAAEAFQRAAGEGSADPRPTAPGRLRVSARPRHPLFSGLEREVGRRVGLGPQALLGCSGAT